MIELRDIFYFITTGFTVASIVLLYVNRNWLPRYFLYLGLFLGMHLLLDFTGKMLAKAAIPNLPLIHLYTLLEFLTLGYFFYGILKIPPLLVRSFKWLIPFIAFLFVVNSLFIQNLLEFNSYSKTTSSLFIILCVLLYFYNALTGQVESPFKLVLGMINSGLLIFYMGTLLVFLFSDFLNRNNQSFLHNIWIVNILLTVVLHASIFFGLFRLYRWRKKQMVTG